MKRIYSTGESDQVTMFTGIEVEYSPAAGTKTLFVVGLQDIDQIATAAQEQEIQHIYFGANHSYQPLTDPEYAQWADMIQHFLRQGFWCTLDLDVGRVETFLDSGLTEHRRFIPMISVKLPYINQLGYNATIKLDDKGFDKTNPGVWCWLLHDLQQRQVFTSWDAYSKDQKI